MGCYLQSNSSFRFNASFCVHLVVVLNPVNDISCCGSHCAGRAVLTSRWSLMCLLFPSSPSTAMKAIATLRRAHVAVVQLYTVRIWPCLRRNKECYLHLFERLVAVVGAGDRFCAAGHVNKDIWSQLCRQRPLRQGEELKFHCSYPFLQKPRIQTFKIWMKQECKERRRWLAVYLLWPSGRRENSYITIAPVT